MGKWKYINWLVVLIILGHMYYYLWNRYEASASVYVLSTAGWLITAFVGYYIFVYRMDRPGGGERNTIARAPVPKPPVRERPKVTFNRKN